MTTRRRGYGAPGSRIGALLGRGRRILFALLLAFLFAPPILLTVLRYVPPPLTPLMVIRLLEGGEGLERDWTPFDRMPPAVVEAAVASEDNLFCTHGGFDWNSINAAIEDWRAGERLRGGSTISMQTAKNLFLWPSRSWVRKALEAWLTLQLELFWDKRRIIEVYLNIAETGSGIYGVTAAADAYFGKEVADLTDREAALIIAILPNPRRWSAAEPTAYVRQRAGSIQTRIRQLGPLLDCVRRGTSSADTRDGSQGATIGSMAFHDRGRKRVQIR